MSPSLPDPTAKPASENPRKTAPALPASTILLLRDGPENLEVFMVERHHKIDFAEGALVFPGGKTEASDGDPALLPYCRPHTDTPDLEFAPAELAVRVGAIRETFEECGVLLARPKGSDSIVDAHRLASIAKDHREALHENTLTMLEFVEREELELAFDLLVPFAHWVTPEFMPKRFDTHFFLVDAPTDHLAVHDGSESVDSLWTTIPGALDLEESGRRTIIFPTLENIRKLGRSGSVSEALHSARNERVVTVLPRLTKDPDGTLMMELPAEAGYDTVRAPVHALSGGRPKASK
jgi:8-oxo-dGTP pyrophosphatase MutT (NUDIX family)